MKTLIENRRARFDFEILETVVAGVVLTGAEVKSLRQKAGSLRGSFVQIVDGQAVLLNAQISPYPYATTVGYDPKRSRRVLLQKRQLYRLGERKQKGQTLVPLELALAGRHIKLVIGLGRGKKQFEKRAQIKARDLAREERAGWTE